MREMFFAVAVLAVWTGSAIADPRLLGLGNNISRCWNVPPGSDAAMVTVVVGFDLNLSGEVVGEPRFLQAFGGDANAQKIAFENARRAIIRCEAHSDYRLPFFEGERLKTIQIVFGPEGVAVTL